jgi:hypothetical protein
MPVAEGEVEGLDYFVPMQRYHVFGLCHGLVSGGMRLR